MILQKDLDVMFRKTSPYIWVLFFVLAFSHSTIANEKHSWEDSVGAQTLPPTEKVYWVNDYNLPRNPDMIAITPQIQDAIDECSANGGGIVTFKPGIYLTGGIFLKNNVHLQIPEGVELWGIQDISYYPEMKSRIAGIEMKWPSAMINVIDQENVAISGKGVINGQGRYLWEKYWNMRADYVDRGLRWIVDYDCKRVRTLLVSDSKDISVKDVTIKQSGFWCVHLLYSEHVTVDGITIRNNIGGQGPSTDGIDIDSSSKILIQNCDIDCHDDNFCLKAGRDADGIRVNRPTEYVVIRNCVSRIGAGLITIGSETSGSIRNVHAYNLKAKGTSAGIKLKSAFTRGGTVENIRVHDIELENVNTAISIGLNWNPAYSYSTLPEEFDPNEIPHHWKVMLEHVDPKKSMPKFKNISIENLTAKGSSTGIIANGHTKSTLDSFTFKNINIECAKPGIISYAKDWTVEDVSLTDKNNQEQALKVENSSKVPFLSSTH